MPSGSRSRWCRLAWQAPAPAPFTADAVDFLGGQVAGGHHAVPCKSEALLPQDSGGLRRHDHGKLTDMNARDALMVLIGPKEVNRTVQLGLGGELQGDGLAIGA